ncbi:MAG TPA: DUF3426 domain-containing protein, partial [Accumulibacter sp.]|nr:DUF3426 domain-containing protein [Accumulibacter sp.]
PAATDEPGMETRNQAPDIEPPVIEPPVIVPDHQHVPLTAEEASPPDDGASGEPLPTSESSAGMDAEVGTPATPVTPLIPVEPAPKPVTGETNEPPDYRRWVANSNGTPVPVASRQPYRGLYALTASLLLLALVGQMLFHFRTPLSVAFPALEPTLTALSNALGTTMPLSRHIEQIGIESSDLQIERGPNRTLALQATLRNRADYPQAYPALELTLTDVNETVLVRRVLLPEEYLSPPAADDPAFPAHADLDVRLWLAAKEVDSSGYRLYVFYP